MGIFDDPGIAAELVRLTRSPRVQYGVGALKRALPFMGGPMTTNTRSIPGAQPRDTGSFAYRSGQGNSFGASVGRLASLLGQGGAQQDPMQALYSQLLEQLQQPVDMPTGVDTEDLMSQIQNALNPMYDKRAAAAKQQSEYGRGQVKDMYRALSNDYERLAPQQAEQAAAAKAEIEGLYGQLRSNIEGSYSRVSEEQSELFNQLGIQDALPEVLEEQQAPVMDALTAASENQAQQQQRYMDIGQADQTYYREGSPNSTMFGNQIQTDMLAELENYLGQVEADRVGGIQSAYFDQLGQANSMLMQQQQMAQQEGSRRQEMLWQMLQGSLQGQQQQKLTPDSFMGSLAPQQQQSVAGAFTQLQRSPEAIYGKVEDPRNPVPGTFVETTPEWYMAQADEMYKRGEIDPATYQALLMYLQLYYKTGQ